MENLKISTEEEAKQVALLRFSIIAPLVNNCHEFSSKSEFFRNAATKEYTLPSGKKVFYSPKTFLAWYLDYIHYGFDALIPKTRRDLGESRKLDDATKDKIIELKQQFPHITGKAIYNKLIENNVICTKNVSIATVYRFLKSKNLKNLPTIERKAFEMEHSNDCWQCDTSHGPVIKVDGKKQQTYLIQIIDDASRLIVGAQFFLNDNAINFQTVLKQAIKTYGIPKKIFVDNGTPYKNLQFQTICASMGSILIHAKPYSPQSKGKIERSFRTIKDNFLNCIDWNSFSNLEQLNEQYYSYVNSEYNNHLHSSINNTPKKRFMQDYDSLKFVQSNEVLDEYFLHSFDRKVALDSTVQLFGKQFEVPSKYMRQRINIKFDPFCLDFAYIYEDGRKVQTIYPVKKVDNSHIKRKTISYEKQNNDTRGIL